MFGTLDAVGNEIILGNGYIYTQSQNGLTSVTRGIAHSYTNTGMISLRDCITHNLGYRSGERRICEHTATTKSVRPFMLVPLGN